jgi:two-component system OmpR family sensor kinase
MKRGRWNSVRVRLTLWNMAILALGLGGSVLTVCFTLQSWMHRSVDQDLAQRIRTVQNRRPFHRPDHHGERHPLWARGDSAAPGERPRPPAGVPPHAGSAPPGRAAPPRGPFPQGPLIAIAMQDWPDDPATKRRASLQFVRGFNADGNPWGPGADLAWDPRPLPAALAGRQQYSTVTLEGIRLRLLTAPRYEEGRIAGALQVATDMSGFDRLWWGLVGTLLALLPLSLLVAGLGGLFLTNRALRPMQDITQAAAQLGAEDLSQRLKVTSQDEFGEMAETFNGMIQRLEQAFGRREAAIQELQRFTADASHELRTPLARIKASATLALRVKRPASEYCEALQVVNEAADVMNRLVQDLLLLARADADRLQIRLEPVAVEELFQRAIAASAPSRASLRVELPDSALSVLGHREFLIRLLTNLIENAIRHTPPAGQLTLSAHEAGDEVVLAVADSGEGIPPEHLPHVCERFYRVDAARTRDEGGAGLGLAICQSIVQAHGGRLEIESEVRRGTTVRVTLSRTHRPAVELKEHPTPLAGTAS